VHASVPVSELGALRIPGVNADTQSASTATVELNAGDRTITKQGRVARLLGDLDPAGQVARVVIAVDDPLDLRRAATEREPLLLGAHVEVGISAGRADNVFELPSVAVRGDRHVWVLEDGALAIRPVYIAWRTPHSVFVDSGLREGEKVVLSNIAAPVPGMKLRADEAADGAEIAEAR
jgi:hypothetical protein